jgi:CheY-like chemotaxis protein
MTNFALTPELLKGRTIVVVDDEPDSLEVARLLLKRCGAEVITAENGQEGLEKAILHRPWFIISDMSMPGMTGWQMMQALRENTATIHIPVIALTANARAGDRDMAFSAGFHNYLSKPLKPESFVSDILNLLMDIPEMAVYLDNRR